MNELMSNIGAMVAGNFLNMALFLGLLHQQSSAGVTLVLLSWSAAYMWWSFTNLISGAALLFQLICVVSSIAALALLMKGVWL